MCEKSNPVVYEPGSSDLMSMDEEDYAAVLNWRALFDEIVPRECPIDEKFTLCRELNACLSYRKGDVFDLKAYSACDFEPDIKQPYTYSKDAKVADYAPNKRYSMIIEYSRQTYPEILAGLEDETTMAIMGLGHYSVAKRKRFFDHICYVTNFCQRYQISHDDELKLFVIADCMRRRHYECAVYRADFLLTARFYDCFAPVIAVPDL